MRCSDSSQSLHPWAEIEKPIEIVTPDLGLVRINPSMQVIFIQLLSWKVNKQKVVDSKSRLDDDALSEIIKDGIVMFNGNENENLGGAPADFLQTMLEEENSERLLTYSHPYGNDRLSSCCSDVGTPPDIF